MNKSAVFLIVLLMILSGWCGVSAQVKAGDEVIFGHYEQDNIADNGSEPIEWQVLQIEGSSALLISRYGLDVIPYDDSGTDEVTWEESTLRSWLNGSFYDGAFSDSEKDRISESSVNNHDGNPAAGVSGGNDTSDKIFLLSVEEAERLFRSDGERIASATQYAAEKIRPGYQENGMGWWWLRSPGGALFMAALVKPSGEIGINGDFINQNFVMVRPALWMTLPEDQLPSEVEIPTDISLSSTSAEIPTPVPPTAVIPTVPQPTATMTPEELADLGENYFQAGSFDAALSYLEPAAEAGNAAAQFRLGYMYDMGIGVASSDAFALRYYRLAAAQNHVTAAYNLALMYVNGQGVVQSYETAAGYYQIAADQGDADAQYGLGLLYFEGNGVDQSYETAGNYFKLAADQGHVYAQYNLGYMYYNGTGFEQSYPMAAKYYQLAADQSDPDAQLNIGALYYDGLGVSQSYETALRYFRMAAEQGNSAAQYNVGYMYEKGEGVAQSYETAAGYYTSSAEAGDAMAQNCLGNLYEHGLGVEQSEEMALRYYQMAADQGNEEAAERLSALLTPQYSVPEVSSLRVGDVVPFGHYEQDEDTENGAEPIEWIVLSVEDDRVLLLSKYGLDAAAYNSDRKSITWEDSTLRKWLNREFLNSAFNVEEQAMILQSLLKNPDNPAHHVSGGNNTRDWVFLLSIDEVRSYLTDNSDRICVPTGHAVANGSNFDKKLGTSWWWLRSPGESGRYAARVEEDGTIFLDGNRANFEGGLVRPALWLIVE